jgi:hypothetical protein
MGSFIRLGAAGYRHTVRANDASRVDPGDSLLLDGVSRQSAADEYAGMVLDQAVRYGAHHLHRTGITAIVITRTEVGQMNLTVSASTPPITPPARRLPRSGRRLLCGTTPERRGLYATTNKIEQISL